MWMSAGFAVLLLVVVAVYYLVPRRPVCAGCGAPRVDEAPLCTACGWIHDSGDEDDEDDDGEPEALETDWPPEAR